MYREAGGQPRAMLPEHSRLIVVEVQVRSRRAVVDCGSQLSIMILVGAVLERERVRSSNASGLAEP